MSQVTIYTKPYCPYCVRAVMLLEKKGVAFTEIQAASTRCCRPRLSP
jgi:glutaredoxin 3